MQDLRINVEDDKINKRSFKSTRSKREIGSRFAARLEMLRRARNRSTRQPVPDASVAQMGRARPARHDR
jgi:predicted P-loop ATPase